MSVILPHRPTQKMASHGRVGLETRRKQPHLPQ